MSPLNLYNEHVKKKTISYVLLNTIKN